MANGRPYEEFAGILPYATELFGLYQPLLGWKGRQTQARVCREQLALTRRVLAEMLDDSRVRGMARDQVMLIGPDAQLAPQVPAWLNSVAATQVLTKTGEFIQNSKRAPADRDDWTRILVAANPAIAEALDDRRSALLERGIEVAVSGSASALAAGAGGSVRTSSVGSISPVRESLIAGMLDYASREAPSLLQRIFLDSKAPWEVTRYFMDPLANFSSQGQNAVLSPVGLVFLYREYFFELGTFLGPPVEHIWLSPGGKVELFEVHTRRTAIERQIEAATEVTARSELTTTNQEELSDAVKQENQENEKFATSASGGVNFGVWGAQGSTSFDLTTNHTTAEENTHKVLRQQSEKLSNEIRRSFKTTFRTTVETEDTFSRRYVMQNTTEKLANYELRRKMRKVGVQVQHIGTQLCWQVYIDEPGKDLGLAMLVHVAKPEDASSSIQPPEAPPPLASKESEMAVDFPFEPRGHAGIQDEADYYYQGSGDIGWEKGHIGDEDAHQVTAQKAFVATPPALGYTLHAVNERSFHGGGDGEGDPSVSATYTVVGADQFQITLNHVNFNAHQYLRFDLTLSWNPPDPSKANEAFEKKMVEFQERERRDAHAEYVKLVRERVKLASGIALRRADELREEERTIVYRRLIRQLTQVGSDQHPHVTAELIRQIFDVDKMLYFVAPDWWMPRMHSQPQPALPVFNPVADSGPRAVDIRRAGDVGNGGASRDGDDGKAPAPVPPAPGGVFGGTVTYSGPVGTTLLTEDDLVAWSGISEKGRNNYLITEDSEPARMGASLGWLLQLDGDNHRNGFLNSPWVKAVIPILPGQEHAALDWLRLSHVEGTDGFDAIYEGPEPGLHGKSIDDVLDILASQVTQLNADTPAALATEAVFETGFDPLEGGFRAPGNPPDGTPFVVFDQWVDILPTDQIVAVEYDPKGS